MARGIVGPEIVDRIDEAPTEEMGPQPIDECLAQHLVIRVGDQLAQLGAADHVGALADLPAVEEPGKRDANQAVATVEIAQTRRSARPAVRCGR